ncbi:MAG: hypothetical protein LBK66_05790 [Spirochaetaceae bacterium]|nr:hypothetical protein [Spirochaetaceae bacterium]
MEVKFFLLAYRQEDDGARRFLVECIIPPGEKKNTLWQKYNLCYIKPVDMAESALAIARFSNEKPSLRKIVHIYSGKVYSMKLYRSKAMNGDLCFILSVDDVLYHGIVIRLPFSVQNKNHQAFLDAYEHPFFKTAAQSSVKPVKTLYDSVPEEFRADIEAVVEMLKNEGAFAVHLFGEAASPQAEKKEGVCLAVSGITSQLYDDIYERIEKSVKTKINLFNMDANSQFFSLLKPSGHMIKLFERGAINN